MSDKYADRMLFGLIMASEGSPQSDHGIDFDGLSYGLSSILSMGYTPDIDLEEPRPNPIIGEDLPLCTPIPEFVGTPFIEQPMDTMVEQLANEGLNPNQMSIPDSQFTCKEPDCATCALDKDMAALSVLGSKPSTINPQPPKARVSLDTTKSILGPRKSPRKQKLEKSKHKRITEWILSLSDSRKEPEPTKKTKHKRSPEGKRKQRQNYKRNLRTKEELRPTYYRNKAKKCETRTVKLMGQYLKESKKKANEYADQKSTTKSTSNKPELNDLATSQFRAEQIELQRRASLTANHSRAYSLLAKNPEQGKSFQDIPKLSDEQAKLLSAKMYCQSKCK